MKVTKKQLRRIIREEKAKVLAEQRIRRRLMENPEFRRASLEDAVRGQDIEIAMGGRGPVIIRNGQDLDMVGTGLDYALEEMWGNMGPEEAYDWFKSTARSVGIDPDTAEDLGLWDHPDFA